MTAPTVVKFGGELLEDPERLSGVVSAIARVTPPRGSTPLVIVHGGGKEIDAALKIAGIEKRQVEGLRITDEATLEVVVAVLAGSVNTRFVAALTAQGVPAIGLTGADGQCGLSEPAPPHRTVDGASSSVVGIPSDRADMRIVTTLGAGWVCPRHRLHRCRCRRPAVQRTPIRSPDVWRRARRAQTGDRRHDGGRARRCRRDHSVARRAGHV